MQKELPNSARLLAGIFAVLFGATLVIALLLVNVEAHLFASGTYKSAFLEQDLYRRMPKLLAEQFSTNPVPCATTPAACPPTPGYLRALSQQDWESLITALIPPQQLQAVSEQSLDSLFDFFNGKNEQPLLVLKPVKQSLLDNSTQAVNRILSAQPACTAEQIADYSLKLLLGQPVDANFLCNPPQQLLNLVLPVAANLFSAQIAVIPDAIPIFDQNRLVEVRAQLDTIRMVMRLSPLLPVIFLALLTLLAVRNLPGWLKWWGMPLTIGAGVSLLLSLSAGAIARLAIMIAAGQENSSQALRLAAKALDVVLAVLKHVTNPMAIEALILLVIGGSMLAANQVLTRNKAH